MTAINIYNYKPNSRLEVGSISAGEGDHRDTGIKGEEEDFSFIMQYLKKITIKSISHLALSCT